MQISSYAFFARHALATLATGRHIPILGTVILTDRCNLHCRHCAVNNVQGRMATWHEVRSDLEHLFARGVRILFFCGGEVFLWKDGEHGLDFLVREARRMGFRIVNIVTNGTLGISVPGVDVTFLSLDGLKEQHDLIRGETFDTILSNLDRAPKANVCVYMAINQRNLQDIRSLAEFARTHPRLNAISFNLHTPYPGTESLTLTESQKHAAIEEIRALIHEGFPVFNLASTLDAFLANQWPRPCPECLVMESGKEFVCGRCSAIPGMCKVCGYLFAVEFSQVYSGNLAAATEALLRWPRFLS